MTSWRRHRKWILAASLCAPLLAPSATARGAQQEPGPSLTPRDNLVVEGLPPIPMSLVEEVDRYTEGRSAGFRSWHPQRREMLIGTRFGNATQIHRLAMPGGARTQLTFYPEPAGLGAYRPETGDFFVFSKDRGGDENYQYYRYDVSTGDVTLVTDGASRNTGWAWSTSGDRAAYGSTQRNGEDVDIWVVDPRDPSHREMLLELDGGGWAVADWSEDDEKLLVRERISANESYLWLVDVATRQRELITPKRGTEKVSYGVAEFSRDGSGFYVTTDRDSEFQRLAFVDLARGTHTVLTSHIEWDVDGFDLSDDGATIAFVTNENGVGVLHLLDTRSGREAPVPGIPPGSVGFAAWHANSKDLALTLASARSPTDVYSLDIRTGVVERWTTSETGGMVTADLNEPEIIRWKSFDGMEISGLLYKPPATFTGPRPVLIDIHGGPEGQARPGFLGRNNYYLKELGVAILFPNVRGSSGYGKTFLTLDNGFDRETSYRDIGALLDWIPTRPDLASDRVMIMGGSYGGFMTLAVASHESDRICCAVDIVGLSNIVTFLENTSAYRRDLRRVEYGDERDPEMRAFLERIAPVNNAQRIRKPLFVVQGRNDPRVPASEAMQIVEKVRANETPVWFLMANDEGHGFAKKDNADFLFYSIVMFMREFLLKEPARARAR